MKNASGQAFKTAPDVQGIDIGYFEPGSTYYIDAQPLQRPSCPEGLNCTMRGGLPQ